MSKAFVYLFTVFILSVSLFAQNPSDKPVWDVTLVTGKNAQSNITVQNRCQKTHNFQIQPQNVPFLEISQTEVSVAGGGNQTVPVRFVTTNLEVKTYQGEVLVVCQTCSSEPTCSQDRETLPVLFTITDTPPTAAVKKKPCKDLIKNCDDLLAIWKKRLSEAADLQTTANEEKDKAEEAKDQADTAEEEARKAEELAENDPSEYEARVNNKEFSSADIGYLDMLRAENYAAYERGQISADRYQDRAKELTPSKAREERLKNKKRLKKMAEKARKKADKLRAKANDAKKKADDAQSNADIAKAEADKAKKDYDECVKKVKAECEKIEQAEAKAEAERKKREAKIRAAEEEADRLRLAEQTRKESEERRKQVKKEKDQELLKLIKELGLIDSRLIKQVPGLWDFLPILSELDKIQMGLIAEGVAQAPIPVDAITAIGRLAGVLGQMFDPCAGAAKQKIIIRIQGLTDPNTGKKYTWGEALKKTDEMCNLLNEIRGKLAAIRKAQQTQK